MSCYNRTEMAIFIVNSKFHVIWPFWEIQNTNCQNGQNDLGLTEDFKYFNIR